MGDKQNNSEDSRYQDVGFVDTESGQGKASPDFLAWDNFSLCLE